MRKNSYNFLWNGGHEAKSFHWVAWNKLALPKDMGGWGLQNLQCFVKALEAKKMWRVLKSDRLLVKFVTHKYIHPYY